MVQRSWIAGPRMDAGDQTVMCIFHTTSWYTQISIRDMPTQKVNLLRKKQTSKMDHIWCNICFNRNVFVTSACFYPVKRKYLQVASWTKGGNKKKFTNPFSPSIKEEMKTRDKEELSVFFTIYCQSNLETIWYVVSFLCQY